MQQERITEIKLACLEQAKFMCPTAPQDILKFAKEFYEWVVATTD